MGRQTMIKDGRGNLLDSEADALVNTVNTVGVMGKGIALQFKRAFPAMFNDYVRACKAGDVRLGTMHVWRTGQISGPRFIINFPTKGHWRASSKLDDIESGLEDLVRVIREEGIESIAVPPLGCGNGGLDWGAVEPRIRAALGAVEELTVELFGPGGAPAASDMRNEEPRPQMTLGRAILIYMLGHYDRLTLNGATPIEIQKLMYLLQVGGQDLRLDFGRHLYGPYADALRHHVMGLEGHYLTGSGDGSKPVQLADEVRTIPGALEEAAEFLAESPETLGRIARVFELIEGYESAYALELLATTLWVMNEDPASAADPDEVVAKVHAWSARKRDMFPDGHIYKAWQALRERGWAPGPA